MAIEEQIRLELTGDSTSLVKSLQESVRALEASKRAVNQEAAEISKQLLTLDKSDKANQVLIRTLKEKLTALKVNRQEIANQVSAYKAQSVALKEVEREATAVERKFKTLGQTVQSAFLPLTVVSGTLTLGLGASIKAFGNFERSLNTIRAVSGATATELNAIRQSTLYLGAKTVFSNQQVADSYVELAKAGFTAKESLQAMPALLTLAAAAGGDLQQAAEIVSGTLKGLGLTSAETSRLVDVMAQAANQSAVDIADMGQAFKQLAPVVQSTGQNFEEMAALLAVLGNSMVKGGDAGSDLRNILLNLTATAGPSAEAMKKLGLSATDDKGNIKSLVQILGELRGKFDELKPAARNTAAEMLVGKENIKSLLILTNTAPQNIQAMVDAMFKAQGAAAEMANTINQGVNTSIEQFGGSVETLASKMGSVLAPAVNLIFGLMTNFINLLASNDALVGATTAVLALAAVVTTLATAVSGFLFAFGPLIQMLKNAEILAGLTAVSFGEVALVIAAVTVVVAGLGAAFAALTQNTRLANRAMEEIEQTSESASLKFEVQAGQLSALSREYDNIAQKAQTTKTEKKRLGQIVDELSIKLPTLKRYLKDVENGYISLSDATRRATEEQALFIKQQKLQDEKARIQKALTEEQKKKKFLDDALNAGPTFAAEGAGEAAYLVQLQRPEVESNVKKLSKQLEAVNARLEGVNTQIKIIRETPIASPKPGTPDNSGKGDFDVSSGKSRPVSDNPVFPVSGGRITSAFGVNRGDHLHQGIDIGAKLGTPVLAPDEGIVVFAGSSGDARGKYVILRTDRDGNQIAQRFFHLSNINVKTGQTVQAGQKIGQVGSTGRSTGPHLHFETAVNGINQDPAEFLKGAFSVGNIQKTLESAAAKKARELEKRETEELAESTKVLNEHLEATADLFDLQVKQLGPYVEETTRLKIELSGVDAQSALLQSELDRLSKKHYQSAKAEQDRVHTVQDLTHQIQELEKRHLDLGNAVEVATRKTEQEREEYIRFQEAIQRDIDTINFDKATEAITTANEQIRSQLGTLYDRGLIAAEHYYQQLEALSKAESQRQIERAEQQVQMDDALMEELRLRALEAQTMSELLDIYRQMGELEKKRAEDVKKVSDLQQQQTRNAQKLREELQKRMVERGNKIADELGSATEQAIVAAFEGQGILGAIKQFGQALKRIIIQNLAQAIADGLKPLFQGIGNTLGGLFNKITGSLLGGNQPAGTSGTGPFANPSQYAGALKGTQSLTGLRAAGAGALGAFAIGAGSYGLGQQLANPITGGLAGAALGAAGGALVGAQIGAIGGPIGALIGGGIGLIAGIFGGSRAKKKRQIARQHAQSLQKHQNLARQLFEDIDEETTLDTLQAKLKKASVNAVGPEAEQQRRQNIDQLKDLIKQREKAIKDFIHDLEGQNRELSNQLALLDAKPFERAALERKQALDELARDTQEALAKFKDSETAKTEILKNEELKRKLIEKNAQEAYKNAAQGLKDLLERRDAIANSDVFTRAKSRSQVKADQLADIDKQLTDAFLTVDSLNKAGILKPDDVSGINKLIQASGVAATNNIQLVFNGITNPDELSEAAKRALQDVFSNLGYGNVV